MSGTKWAFGIDPIVVCWLLHSFFIGPLYRTDQIVLSDRRVAMSRLQRRRPGGHIQEGGWDTSISFYCDRLTTANVLRIKRLDKKKDLERKGRLV